jgi:DNA invertase Pin-like site-specific DNA recombinase
MRGVIYARCSTDEKRQDVEPQLKVLREIFKRENIEFDEVWEYDSGSKHVPEKLHKTIELIKDGVYKEFLVFDLTRFSRLHPSTSSRMMDFIVSHKCRFRSYQDNIDSNDEIKWLVIKPLFQYMSWVYSKNLSEKVKLGMARAKEKGSVIGRPKGSNDKKPRSKKGYFLRKKENPLGF